MDKITARCSFCGEPVHADGTGHEDCPNEERAAMALDRLAASAAEIASTLDRISDSLVETTERLASLSDWLSNVNNTLQAR